MKRIIDQTILLIYCIAVLLLIPMGTEFVVATLAAVIYGSVTLFLRSGKEHMVITVLWLAAAYFCPEILLFMPVAVYSVLERKQYLLAAVCMGLAVAYGAEEGVRVLCYVMIGCMMAALLQYKEGLYERLDEKLRKTRDDGEELNLLLKEKNQNLLKQQDYEIYTATLKERNRIAREIHDNVGHMLSRSILMIGAMKAVSQDEKMKAPLGQLEDTLNAAMTSVRESVHDLHDESVNLKETVENLAKEFAFCPVRLEYDMGYEVPRTMKYSFIMIMKEALNNVMKHSDATEVHILMREHPGLYQLIIEDNGNERKSGNRQESVSAASEVTAGMGIRNMQERIAALDGTFQIRREKGFRIYITVPKNEV